MIATLLASASRVAESQSPWPTYPLFSAAGGCNVRRYKDTENSAHHASSTEKRCGYTHSLFTGGDKGGGTPPWLRDEGPSATNVESQTVFRSPHDILIPLLLTSLDYTLTPMPLCSTFGLLSFLVISLHHIHRSSLTLDVLCTTTYG